MDNLQKYNQVFIKSFSVDEETLKDDFSYNTIDAWDSIGHMTMIAELEEAFNIRMEMDDIVDFSSYKKGKEILTKNYGIEF